MQAPAQNIDLWVIENLVRYKWCVLTFLWHNREAERHIALVLACLRCDRSYGTGTTIIIVVIYYCIQFPENN